MTQSGSHRIYTRKIDNIGRTVIHVQGVSRTENHAFITMARHFHSQRLPVPEVYEVSTDEMEYTQEDLGEMLLFDYIKNGRETGHFSAHEKAMLSRTIRALAHIQTEGAKGLDWSVCYPVPTFDQRSIMWDLNYFKYNFLKLKGIEIDECALENDFEHLSHLLLDVQSETFMYRDFQSRNVMIHDNQPYFIDFQGGRRGPIYYDLASFLWQAKANFPPALREEMLDEYLDELHKIGYSVLPSSRQEFRRILNEFVLFRTLQVLGAYGLRGLYECKRHFVQSIPFAIRNLADLWTNHSELIAQYPYLYTLTQQLLSDMAPISPTLQDKSKQETLEIDILSFSFKHGLPQDTSGNGGGYIFDCRSTHNPGKYDAYKHLTGMDQPVIDFLEKDGEITVFLDSVYKLVDHHINRFLERGFTHLQIAFGCTGGQHRSVYSAEATAKHIHEQFAHAPIRLSITHREQGKKVSIEI